MWEEVRRLNTELGMTIFLTTQYLEEADTLADRVGIIDTGRIVAEGTPTELKRSVGTDVIIIRVDGDGAAVCPAISRVPGIISVEAHDSEIVVSTGDGSGTVSPVAVALSACEVRVRDLTPAHADPRRRVPRAHGKPHPARQQRRGGRAMTVDATTIPGPAPVIRARPAGFVSDTAAIAGRALRAIPRDVEAVIPPIFIALFFYLVNIGTLSDLTESQIEGFDFKAFQLPTAILLGVTGVSRAPAFVLDVQNGYFDRLLLTPIRRLAILLGHMAADVAVACGLIIPITIVGFIVGVRFETGPLGVLVFILIGALWSLAFSGFGYAIALKTGNPAAVNSSFLLFFPFLFLTTSYVPREALSGLARHGGDLEPGHVSPGRDAVPHQRGLGVGGAGRRPARHRHRRRGEHDAVLRRAARPHPPRLTQPARSGVGRKRRGWRPST